MDGVSKYDFYIYGRQGQKIFHTQNTEEGWNGNIENSDKNAISGKYMHIL